MGDIEVRKFKKYLVSYNYDGARWNFELDASSFEDARRRLDQMIYAQVDGVVVANIPAHAGIFVWLTVKLRNFFLRNKS